MREVCEYDYDLQENVYKDMYYVHPDELVNFLETQPCMVALGITQVRHMTVSAGFLKYVLKLA